MIDTGTTSTSSSLAQELDSHMIDHQRTSTSTSSSSALSRFVGNVRVQQVDRAARQVRQNVGSSNINDGKGIYLKRFELDKDDLDNIKMVKSETAAIMTRRPYNPNSKLISLEDLINNRSMFGTNSVLIILSISATSKDNMTTYQQKYNGVKGNNGTIRHDRTMVVMCPFSKAGNNTAIILFGAGCCERLLDGDISLRDNGEIRE